MFVSCPLAQRFALILTASLGLVARLTAQATFPPAGTAQYTVLTDNKVEVSNSNPEPFTGIAFAADGTAYAVNPYGNLVVAYRNITPTPDLIIPTGLNPVSVGVWEPDDTLPSRRVLVACNGTHGLFMHSAVDGRILNYLQLDSEPADLAVDNENSRAFVSCQGDNTVVQVDLATFTITKRYAISCGIRPGPLYLDRGNPTTAGDERVYVAAAVTGNNTVPTMATGGAAGAIHKLDGNPGGELPDEDVFRIDPSLQTITPIIRRAGSLIFDIGRNPASGDVWIVSTDSINGDPGLDTEPELKGKFAINQLVRVSGVTNSSPLVTAGAGIDLDDWDANTPGAQYSAARSVNQARTIAFGNGGSLQGHAFVASAQSDLIIVLDPNGVRVAELQLPAGAQCYHVSVWNVVENVLVALCLGTMTLEVYDWTLQSTPIGSVPLGLDPTPDQIRRGRNVFMDGSRSAAGRFTCASCHPRGMTDMLAWPLRGDPTDEKDIMLTQSLLSIADSYPHHWRGERELVDFRKAFGGLLGAPAVKVPTTSEMEDFMVFLRSLQAPANPLENNLRVIDDNIGTSPAPNGMTGSPTTGQSVFESVAIFNGQTCAGCHQAETGSDATHILEVLGVSAPRTTSLEVAHLRQLQHRRLETIQVSLGGPAITFNRNGYGATHNGVNPSLFTFINDTGVFQALGPQGLVDTFRYTEQFDQGISPAVHFGAFFDMSSSHHVVTDIETILLDGSKRGWNDVVAIGRFDSGAGFEPMRWLYSSVTRSFISDTRGIMLSWARMQHLTRRGKAENVFLGVPLANGERFGRDHDRDGLPNGDEAAAGTSPWVSDFDADGWPDGYELQHGDDPRIPQTTSNDATAPALLVGELDFANSRLAKYHVRFSEDVKYTVTYAAVNGPVRTFKRDYFTTADTFVLTHEEPSTPSLNLPGTPITLNFAVSIRFVDRNGLAGGPIPLTQFQPDEAAVQGLLFTHVKGMEWVSQTRTGNTLTAQVRIKLDYNYGAPAFNLAEVANQMVFSSLAVLDPVTGNFVKSTSFTSSDPTTFGIGAPPPGLLYDVDPGAPWVTSPLTDARGETVVNFQLSGLTPGQEVKLSVMGIVNPIAGTSPVVYEGGSVFQMQPLLLENTLELSTIF